MLFNLSEQNSIANHFVAELRDLTIQKDRLRFRKNVERLGQIMAYEISKKLVYRQQAVETPLGTSNHFANGSRSNLNHSNACRITILSRVSRFF